MKKFRSTLVSDGRKDAAERPLINCYFINNTPLGPTFDGVDDMFGIEKNGKNLADGLVKRIDAKPKGTYVQLLTDLAAPGALCQSAASFACLG